MWKFLFIVIAFSSCAHMSREECEKKDWFAVGRDDALAGKNESTLPYYQMLCERESANVNSAQYNRGRAEGLRLFCTEKNGFRFASNGGEYHGVCPKEQLDSFLRGYLEGQKHWAITQKENHVKALETEVSKREQQLKENEEKLRIKNAILANVPGKICSFDSDCRSNSNSCQFGKCGGTGAKCTFDSDCGPRPTCSRERVCAGADCEYFNICKP